MSLVMKLEAMCGDTIEETCNQIVEIAHRINITVEVNFNGVVLMAFRGGDPRYLIEGYGQEINSGHKFKMVTTSK